MITALALYLLGGLISYGWMVIVIRLGAEMGFPFPGGKLGIIWPAMIWPLTLGCVLGGRPEGF